MNNQESTYPWLVFEVARCTLEVESTFRIGSGEGDGLHDAVFVTDCNGLPAIPGDSLAGVMRHALANGSDPATNPTCCAVFGYQQKSAGQASAVQCSWASVHSRNDTPVPFREANMDDAVLALLAAGVPRDHVRIGPHGAVDERGKFDELVVPAGARFTFELVVDSRCPVSALELVQLLARPETRIGAATRRGLGRVHPIRCRIGRFDLRQRADRERYARLPIPLEKGDGGTLDPQEIEAAVASGRWVHGTIQLAAADTWAIGGTIPSGRETKRQEKNSKPGWDKFPFTEQHIEWATQGNGSDRGAVVSREEAPFVIPATSIKGALRHRTAFHARRLQGDSWLTANNRDAAATPEEVSLFGEIREADRGQPGVVLLGDVRVDPNDVALAPFQHVCLDRFTQGPMDGLLFDEVVAHGGAFEVDIDVCVDRLSSRARQALGAALDDLCSQRLALGSGRSHGRFAGETVWDDGGRWMEEGLS